MLQLRIYTAYFVNHAGPEVQGKNADMITGKNPLACSSYLSYSIYVYISSCVKRKIYLASFVYPCLLKYVSQVNFTQRQESI
jgi:hypothetical protein